MHRLGRALILGFLLPLVFPLPHVSAHEDSAVAAPEPDVLYLSVADPIFGARNFTTYPPRADESGYALGGAQMAEGQVWLWGMRSVPTEWILDADGPLEAVLYVEGLDGSSASPNTHDPDVPFGVPFTVELLHLHAQGRVATGRVVVPVDPLDPPAGVVEVRVPLMMRDDVRFAHNETASDGLALRVVAETQQLVSSPLNIIVDGDSTPSRLVVPGFPVVLFRAWEDDADVRLCLYQKWLGVPCMTPAPATATPASSEDPPSGEAAPAPALVPFVLAAAVATAFLRARRARP